MKSHLVRGSFPFSFDLFSKSSPEEKTANEQIWLARIDMKSRKWTGHKKHPVPEVRLKDKDFGYDLMKHLSKTLIPTDFKRTPVQAYSRICV